MFAAASQQSSSLDVPTLSFVAICIAGLLGLFLIIAWLQQRDARSLAWWGSAYLIGASSMAMWSAPAPIFELPPELPAALIFVACGMIWNGVRLFHGRRLVPAGIFAGAVAWVILNQFPPLAMGSIAHMALGAVIVTGYTLFIAFEFWRERRKSHYSRTAAILVTGLHAGIFLMPLTLRAFHPAVFASGWLTVFALETIIYSVGLAFIMLLLVKDHYVQVYRSAASTDHLTGLLSRGAFMECAILLCTHHGQRGRPVTLMMFDLDHFKTINDRFGHAVGDDVLRLFAQVARKSMRASDIIGRLGGEEFAAIVPEPMEGAKIIAERLRAAFEAAGVSVGAHAIGATVSIGAAQSYEPVLDIDALLGRADAALYRAKHDGRNRIRTADDEPAPTQGTRLVAAARNGRAPKGGRLLQRKSAARRPKSAAPAVNGESATTRLLYPR
jgi:diguanylate cyclase (GGDEF)-like protein